MLLLMAVGIPLLTGVGLGAWVYIARSSQQEEKVDLLEPLKALDTDRHLEAKRLAELLRKQQPDSREAQAISAFVIGSSISHQADGAFAAGRAAQYLLAAKYLEEARTRGYPTGRSEDGEYLLGRSLCLGGRYRDGITVLDNLLAKTTEHPAEVYRLLAMACLNDAKPQLDKALEHNAEYLANERLTPDQGEMALIQRAGILLRLDRRVDCGRVLDKIPKNTPHRAETQVLRGELELLDARTLAKSGKATPEQVQAKYDGALATLKKAQTADALATEATARAMYLVGQCLLETGDKRGALSQWTRTWRTFPSTHEGLAADFQAGELLRTFGRDADALESYRRVLKAIDDPERFTNPLLDAETLRRQIPRIYQEYLDNGKLDQALELAALGKGILTEARSVELTAEAERTRGKNLLTQAESLPPAQADPMQADGRKWLRQAGRTLTKLARLRFATRQYPDDLWASAAAFTEGHDFANAVKMLQEYLKTQDREHRPRALVSLGESLVTLGRFDEAIKAFHECLLFFPRDAACYKARLGAAAARIEKAEYAEARALLEENLTGDLLSPESAEWRDSLFALGRLLYIQGDYERAAVRLDEAVARYPQAPEAAEALYMAAESYRHAARKAAEKLLDQKVERDRLVQSKKAREYLTEALDRLRRTQQMLSDRQAVRELSPPDRALLRNCYFLIGTVLYELGDEEQSVAALAMAASRYQNTPEVLEAYVQLAQIQRRLSRPDAAREAIARAKVVLNRLKDDAKFTAATNYTRQEWAERLEREGTM